ncbi:unnamed protein product, partial [Boreogadus saida]
RGTSEEHQQRGGGGGHLPGFFGRAQKEVGTTGLSGEGTLTRRGDEVTWRRDGSGGGGRARALPCAYVCVCVRARSDANSSSKHTRAGGRQRPRRRHAEVPGQGPYESHQDGRRGPRP